MPANPRSESRIYLLLPSISVAVERSADQISPNSFGSSDGADFAQVSDDNQTLGYTLQDVQQKTISEVRRGTDVTVLGEGKLYLSRNDRWALLAQDASATLIDLTTGTRSDVPVPLPGAVLPLSSNGTILVNPVSLWNNGVLTPLPLPPTARPIAMSGNSQIVVYTLGAQLRALNIATGQDTLLSDSLFPIVMGLSTDGTRVLYRIAGISYTADTSTGTGTPLPLSPGELTTAGTLSGDGTSVFLATTTGRIVHRRIDNSPYIPESVLPPTPSVTFEAGLVPGSFARLHGTNLPFLPKEVAGHILFGDYSAPILAVVPGEIDIQVPWELQGHEFDTIFTLDLPSESPFRQRQGSVLLPESPRFELAPAGVPSLFGLKFFKADFSNYLIGLPQPGEIIQVYMTGLGPVVGPVRTFEPAPFDSLRPLRDTLQCRFTPQTTMADTLFAGLAPGLIGVYQVTFRMPQEPVPPKLTGMNCGNFAFGVLF